MFLLSTYLLETCNTTDSMRKTATCRIESHMRHVVCRVFTVYDLMRNVVYRGFTAIYLGRGMSCIVAYYIIGKTRTFFTNIYF